MIGNVKPLLAQMEPELLKSLVTEIKETIASDIPEVELPIRSFSIVDMWNIRRNSNYARNRFDR